MVLASVYLSGKILFKEPTTLDSNSSSVSTSLPSTATIKPVECWLIFNLAYPFMLVLVATIEKVLLSFKKFSVFEKEIFLENIGWNLPTRAAFKGKDDLPGIVVEVSNERINEENSTIDLLAFLCYLLDYFSFPFRKIKKVRIFVLFYF